MMSLLKRVIFVQSFLFISEAAGRNKVVGSDTKKTHAVLAFETIPHASPCCLSFHRFGAEACITLGLEWEVHRTDGRPDRII